MLNYTNEQKLIIESEAKIMNVGAAPGAGKTATILGVVNHHKKDNHLIMCFNAPIKDSIREKIEKQKINNAEVYTFHGLAFDFFSNSDIIKNFKNRKVDDMDYFTMEPIIKKLGYDYKKTAYYVNVLNGFFVSNKTADEYFFDIENADDYRTILRFLKDDHEAPVFHSFYIKIFQLMRFSTNKFDTVLIDEAQDVNGCYSAIIDNLKADRVIRLGDDAQKIYGFNGAVGLSNVNFRLSNSFRISKDASDMCNALISEFIKDDSMFFEGLNEEAKVVENFDQLDRVTIIYRTNKKMLKRLMSECDKGKICTIVGGKSSLGLNTIEGIYKATKEDPFYYRNKKITCIKDAETLCALTRSQDIKRALEFIAEYKNNTMKIVNVINNHTVDEADYADFTFTTAHRSKGLEFKNVEIGDDFPTISKLYELASEGRPHIDEIYVLYVALSRCHGKMKLNNDLNHWFNLIRQGKTVRRIESRWDEVEF